MTTIQDLPELAIIGILRNAMEKITEVNDIVSNLSYLAISQRWRRLGVPIVYNDILIRYDSTKNENDDEEAEYKFSSNISLITNNHCNSLVKRLQISWGGNTFADTLDELMNTIVMNETSWPKDSSSHLVGDTLDSYFSYNPQKLDKEMYERMSAIIDNFRDTYPNVIEIKFDITGSCGVASQLINKFVEVYSSQLTKLKIYGGIPLDLPCFPPNLTYLSYMCQPASFLPMPIINSWPLKVLKLKDIPKNFSWKQCCNSLVFPNLEKLFIDCLSGNNQREREELAHELGIQLDIPDAKQEHLEFPDIHTLILFLDDTQINRFHLKEVPAHLTELHLICTLDALNHFRKLPIYSISMVFITIYDKINDLGIFYKVTNKMLSKRIGNNAISRFRYLLEEPVIDFQMTFWDNATIMKFEYLSSSSLIEALAAMPELIEFDINYCTYIDEDVDWSTLANSKIETLVLRSCQYNEPLEKPANFVLQLFKSLKCLQEVSVPETLQNELLPKLEEAKKEHQHLQELEVDWV